jgi:hypothetical protein
MSPGRARRGEIMAVEGVPSETLPENFDDLPLVEQRRILTSGYEMTQLAYRHSTAILIAPPASVGGEISHGSGFVLHLNGNFYLGTAWHVVEPWLRRVEQGENLKCQVSEAILAPVDRIAWKDEANDIVFLRLTAEEARQINVSVCEPVVRWPPQHPTVGSYVLVAGYPKTIRNQPGPREVDFSCLSVLLEVTAVGERHMICQFHRERYVNFGPNGIPPAGTFLGGISGGPVLGVRNLSYPVIGLVSEFSHDYELLYVKTLSHLPPSF